VLSAGEFTAAVCLDEIDASFKLLKRLEDPKYVDNVLNAGAEHTATAETAEKRKQVLIAGVARSISAVNGWIRKHKKMLRELGHTEAIRNPYKKITRRRKKRSK
jgi:hypothetical protein